jgi:DNA recombination protein RmuC
MAAYLDAVEAADDETREAHLVAHARQLRTHMRLLAGKAYWDALPCTPDFVAMFIPGENFYAAAIERDPLLFEHAIENKVLIVTPTTLIALAKAIAMGWRQEKVAENARHIGELGRELYRRLATMGGHVAGVGAGLDSAVKRYNDLVGSLESRVMPKARQFSELEVEGTREPLAELKPVETQTRLLRADPDPATRDAEIIPLIAGERTQTGE